jgi:hypothetical protein
VVFTGLGAERPQHAPRAIFRFDQGPDQDGALPLEQYQYEEPPPAWRRDRLPTGPTPIEALRHIGAGNPVEQRPPLVLKREKLRRIANDLAPFDD